MKKSVLDNLRTYQKEITDGVFNSHFLVGVDMTDDGIPHASMMISKGKPFEVLGMIDLLIKNLNDTREDLLKSLSQRERQEDDQDEDRIKKILSKLPAELRDKIMSIKKRMHDAMENRDENALRELKRELENLNSAHLKDIFESQNENDDDDDGNFNISDFKGGLA